MLSLHPHVPISPVPASDASPLLSGNSLTLGDALCLRRLARPGGTEAALLGCRATETSCSAAHVGPCRPWLEVCSARHAPTPTFLSLPTALHTDGPSSFKTPPSLGPSGPPPPPPLPCLAGALLFSLSSSWPRWGSRPDSDFKLFFCLFFLVCYFSGTPLFLSVLTEFQRLVLTSPAFLTASSKSLDPGDRLVAAGGSARRADGRHWCRTSGVLIPRSVAAITS